MVDVLTPLLDAEPGSPKAGLDYGCGPGPTLSLMLKEKGIALYSCVPIATARTVVRLFRERDCLS